jgi:hypothetical protein
MTTKRMNPLFNLPLLTRKELKDWLYNIQKLLNITAHYLVADNRGCVGELLQETVRQVPV